MSDYLISDKALGPSVGLVLPQSVDLGSLPLDSGESLEPVTIAYETYGRLNRERSNAILIAHALSGDAHAAGYHSDETKPGWWETMIGPGKGFDTNRYFVVCSNVIGGCKGSTGPISINPATGKEYGLEFPVVTVGDMVRAQKLLVDRLGIERLLSVSGGSMGGMQALQWAVAYPDVVASCIPIAATTKHSPMQIAFNEVGRLAIMSDQNWNNGDYYGGPAPDSGLAVARMIGHITYLSDESMHKKFGRRLRDKETLGYDFTMDFEVESYLRHQGEVFTRRFDANTYLYVTKALDYFDLSGGRGLLEEAFRDLPEDMRFLVIAFSSDWLYPPYQSKEIVRALKGNGIDCSYLEMKSSYGHDAFLLENKDLTRMVWHFLETTAKRRGVHLAG
ncbi:MAG: homoserine O-acetyltransferase [Thermoleophilia bacterium]|nr:homoserine O-acetyltransferase [Thermoleophilia bacterium]